MSTLKAIALDDEPPALKVLGSLCKQTSSINLVQTFTKPSEATSFLQNNAVDLIFLDINMPTISGIDFFKSVPQPVMLIFTTAFSEFALEGFNLQAIDYLLKPITPERFEQACQKALLYYEKVLSSQENEITPEYLQIRADYSLHQIAFEDIILVEALDDYVKIHCTTGKPIVARMTLKNLQLKLPEKLFIRVHKSYIISFNKIKALRNKVVYLPNFEIPLGPTYEKVLLARLKGLD
ncbi:LytR/AlgR family response regulator transcription factor [Flectobacillus longus]|uniref:LytR/AlgR family response regulator transcription factor n=1 Tax=Flectobacillus longus TaxID=2984207 RepID=UPI0024B7E807|nr:LytTR family DNA-binding domain-containing protein [Flectobacillus longus]MDI9878665.1 LytTR family DNA-binding domain-containing protein [Flectobacillus longus]